MVGRRGEETKVLRLSGRSRKVGGGKPLREEASASRARQSVESSEALGTGHWAGAKVKVYGTR